jgi:hypothetical protein
MARTKRTAEIEIDGRTYVIGPLTIGQLRELSGDHEKAKDDPLSALLVDAKAIHMAIGRGQGIDGLPSLAEFEKILDGDDLAIARVAVWKLSGTIRQDAGEQLSP